MNRSLYVRGTTVEDGQIRELVIVDGVVADASPMPSREPDAAGWVLPGLADVHNHLSLASPAGGDEEPAIRVRASASVELAVGVLAIREPGSPDDASMLLAGEAGWPRVVTAGRFLSPPGGYFPGLARETLSRCSPAAPICCPPGRIVPLRPTHVEVACWRGGNNPASLAGSRGAIRRTWRRRKTNRGRLGPGGGGPRRDARADLAASGRRGRAGPCPARLPGCPAARHLAAQAACPRQRRG
jgi:hypothetical protein